MISHCGFGQIYFKVRIEGLRDLDHGLQKDFGFDSLSHWIGY